MSKRKQQAIVALAELYGRKLTEPSVRMFLMASASISDEQFEQAAAVMAQRSKFMPSPAELIELIRCDGVSYEARAELALEELEHALDDNRPSLMSPLTEAVARQIGGFQTLRSMPIAEFRTWKRKDFLNTYIALVRENPERLQAIAGPRSELSKSLRASLSLKNLASHDEAQTESENRRKLKQLTTNAV